jgi:hypothetical protein
MITLSEIQFQFLVVGDLFVLLLVLCILRFQKSVDSSLVILIHVSALLRLTSENSHLCQTCDIRNTEAVIRLRIGFVCAVRD